MKKTIGLGVVLWIAAGTSYSVLSFGAQIDGVEFKIVNDQNVIEISGDDLSSHKEELKKNPPQLVLTFKDTQIADTAAKKLDTSSFQGNVLQISSYPLSAESGQSRVVVDLKKTTAYTVNEAGGKLVIKFDPSPASKTTTAEEKAPISDEPKSELSETLDKTIVALNEKKFTGSPITLKLKDADIHDVLRMISEASGFNIVIHPSIQGKISLSLDQVPWDQALEVVLTTLRLSAERNESVLRVLPREMFIAEKNQQLEETKMSAAVAPRVTRVFPISYADLSDLSTLLTGFANSQNQQPGNTGSPATILTDKTTQSLIVRDTSENLERIKKMIELLDVQTPQVLVEGKVVEATEQFSKSMNGNFGIGGPHYGFAFNGPLSLAGNPTIGDTTGLLNGGQSPVGGLFQGADIFKISGRAVSIAAALNMGEKENKLKVVSSPRTVVLSGKTANISQANSVGILVAIPGTGGSPGGQEIKTIQANTKLSVTPRVTNDGSVLMKIDLTRDVLNRTNPAAPVAEPRQMTTEVIVDSGTTLVIGGVLNVDESHNEFGFPFLRKIPLVGWLFGGEGDDTSRSELMFFVTPRVLNPKKTGLIMEENTAKL